MTKISTYQNLDEFEDAFDTDDANAVYNYCDKNIEKANKFVQSHPFLTYRKRDVALHIRQTIEDEAGQGMSLYYLRHYFISPEHYSEILHNTGSIADDVRFVENDEGEEEWRPADEVEDIIMEDAINDLKENDYRAAVLFLTHWAIEWDKVAEAKIDQGFIIHIESEDGTDMYFLNHNPSVDNMNRSISAFSEKHEGGGILY